MATSTPAQRYAEYLQIAANPDSMVKVSRLDFLNNDNSIAFSIDDSYKRGYGGYSDSRAFLQDGTLNVSLQNGKRRKASITLENLDREFEYSVNKLWFGSRVRLLMGVKLSDGSNYYLPQGVFYLSSPTLSWRPTGRTMEYPLTDKWAYLDGSLFGTLNESYTLGLGSDIFEAAQAFLHLSRYTLQSTGRIGDMIDCTPPMFTSYYKNRTTTVNGTVYPYTAIPQDILIEYGGNIANALLKLNDVIAGWIGYDSTGALNMLPSENDIADQTKPVLWEFTPTSKTFFGLDETYNNEDVYNEVTIVGEATDSNGNVAPVGRAINNDATSPTSIGRIGRKSYVESSDGYYTVSQCQALAKFRLKRFAALQSSISLDCTQLFHLQENNLITIQRTDKEGSPIERHLIQSYSLPIAQKKTMSITATSVSDFPNITVE